MWHALARSEAIERPVYDFSTYIRIPKQTETVRAGGFVLVEGLFALYYSELLPLYQLRVYVDTPDGVCFDRRLSATSKQRGRTAESVRRAIRGDSASIEHPVCAAFGG